MYVFICALKFRNHGMFSCKETIRLYLRMYMLDICSSCVWKLLSWISISPPHVRLSAHYHFWSSLPIKVPIFGYHKKNYIIIAAAVGSLAFALLSFAPLDSAVNFAALLFFAAHFGVVTVDLLCEGKYAEMMVQHPFTGSDCVSFVWGVYMLGQLAASGVVGPMSDAGLVRQVFLICLPLAIQVCGSFYKDI